jgi:23S rRNA pseudouridine2605 synthase
MEQRIQKILAQAGLGSRRACEELIAQGRVTVNGQRAELGAKADPQTDRILLDGKPVKAPEAPVYIALHKPRGVISAAESPDTRQTVRDLVPVPGHLYPVGRLDVDSEGLILLTNDGELTNRLTHPRYEHEKEYRVLVARHPEQEQLEAWQHGVVLEHGHKAAPAKVWVEALYGKGAWLRVVMHEGRKRQIRETAGLIGLPVVRIVRVRIGTLELGRLKPGEWRQLTSTEVAALRGQPGKAASKPKKAGSKPGKSSDPSRPRRTSERGK